MAYSCAYFTRIPGTPDGYGLEDAQRDKLDLVCRKLGLEAGHAAARRRLRLGIAEPPRGRRNTASTSSGSPCPVEQKAFIDKRIAERGLQGPVEIRVQDYREIPDGPFDAVASLEMGEHVGAANYARYAAGPATTTLQPGGRVLVQQMSRAAAGIPAAARSSSPS